MNNSDDSDDQWIVSQIVSGKPELFRYIIKRYEKAVCALGMGFFRNTCDAADFTQDVFLKVFRSLASFEGRSRFSTWLYKVAYTTAINRKQRTKEYQTLADENSVIAEGTPEREAMRQAIRSAVQEAVADLPERYRVCIDLFFFYDRSYQEIEEITGFPVNTIKSHVLRAKKLLRKKLEGLVEGGF
ncbi:MAG: sigma-70 family RNA polymerase sigma factor [Spirochaetaceae bacterium]|jgi:RNA polymerase sigma-70 factor (ECF subfamily)|nr:sigma-70 family RNA polymerase sigma factor [Spirochaetaceae bacterium]